MGLVTTLGVITLDDGYAGSSNRLRQKNAVILPHEHVFVDLRAWDTPGHAHAEIDHVVEVMAPELTSAREAGVELIVDCTPVGVGRRVDILKALSQATDYPLVVPTGVYREPWIPEWVLEKDEGELVDWMAAELEEEAGYPVKNTGVKAGWIKLSAGDDGMTEAETKILRAAARAASTCDAVIGSHTIRGRVVRDQLAVLAECGYTADRFIWIHAQIDPDFELNLEMAWRGAWIEYDAIGDPDYTSVILERILRMLDAGQGDQVLLSQDRGWYDPAAPGGGTPRPFTYLTESFLPKLREAGVDEETIVALTRENPYRAFSRKI